MALNVGELYATLGLDTKPFEKGIDGSSSRLSKIGAAARGVVSKVAGVLKTSMKVGAVAAAGMTASLAYVGTGYNNLEQGARAAFKTILGSSEAADEMMGKIAEFGASSPFPRQAFIKGTQQLLGFGLEAEKVIPTLGAVQDAVAAAGGGAPEIESITYALAQVQGTGKLTGETLNQLGQYGIDAASIIGDQMGKTSDEIRKLASKPGGIPADKVFMPLVDGLTEKFGGAAANVKQTWAGAVDRIKGAWRDLGSDLMEPLISKAGGGMAVDLANTFATSLRDVQKKIMPFITATVAQVSSAITPILNDVMGQFTSLLAPVMAQLLPVIAPIAEQIGGVLLDAMNALAPVLPVIAQIVAELATALSSGLSSALSSLMPVLAGLAQALAGSFLSVLEAVVPVLPQIIGFVGQLAATFAAGLASAINAVAPVLAQIAWILGGVLAAALDAVTPILPLLSTLFSQLASTLGGALAKAFKALAPVIPKLVDAFSAVAEAVSGALIDALDALAPVLPSLASAFGKIAGVVAQVFVTALDALAPILPTIVDAFVDLVNTAAPLLSQFAPVLAELASTLGETLINAINAIAPLLPDLVDAFGQLATQLVTALAPILPTIVDAFTSLLPALVPLLPPLVTLATTLIDLLAKVPPGAIQAIVVAVAGFKVAQSAAKGVTRLADGLFQVGKAPGALKQAKTAVTELGSRVKKISTEKLTKVKAGFKSLGNGAVKAKDGINKMVISLGTAAKAAANWAKEGIKSAANWAKATAATVAHKVASLAQAAATKIVTAAQWLWNAAMNANPIGLIVAAIAALAAAVVLAYQKVGWFRDIIDAVASFFTDTLWPILQEIAEWIGTVFSAAIEGIGTVFSTVADIIGTVVGTIRDVITAVFEGIRSTVSTVWDAIKSAITTPIGAAKNVVTTVIDTIRSTVSGVFNGIRSTVSTVWDAIKSAITTPFNAAKETVKSTIETIRSTVSRVFGKIKTKVTEIWDGIKSTIKKSVQSVKDFIGGIWDGAGDGLKGILQGAIDLLNKGIRFINEKLIHNANKVPFVDIPDIPSIPPLAKGTDWFRGGVALVGEKGPELVTLPRGVAVHTAAATRGMMRDLAGRTPTPSPPASPVLAGPQRSGGGVTFGDVIVTDKPTAEMVLRQAEFYVAQGRL